MKNKKRKRSPLQWGRQTSAHAERTRKALTPEQIQELRTKLSATYGREPHEFQLEGIRAQLEGRDVLVQASTGAGKTTVAAGPQSMMARPRWWDRGSSKYGVKGWHGLMKAWKRQ